MKNVVIDLARRFAGHLAALLALSAAGAAIALLGPVPLQIAVDVVVEHAPPPRWIAPLVRAAGPLVLPAAAALGVLVALLSQVEGVGSGLVSTLVGERLILDLRARMFAAALRRPIARHAVEGAADALYRIESDAQAVESILLDGALPVCSALMTLAAMLVALLRLSPPLAAIGLGVAPPLLLTARALRPALKQGSRDARERESRALSVVQEALGALPAVKALGREEAEAGRFAALCEGVVRARLRVSWLGGQLAGGVHLLCAVSTALALFVAIRQVEQGRLTLGQALLALGYVARIHGPLRTLAHTWGSLETQIAGLERAAALVGEPAEAPARGGALRLGRARGDLALVGVTFGYDERRPVLDGASLSIAAGEHVGIVGATGAGKTTLLSLLLRLYDPVAGRILLDGVDLRDVALDDLRRQLAVVFQETAIFQGTIAENIAIGRPGAAAQEIEAAARAANLDEAVRRLPDGYATPVGERGVALSGGERQRVGLARAFLRDAPVLVLDEPTSALDEATEDGVLDALARLMEGRTVLTITHRARALYGCDRIVRVEDGKLGEAPDVGCADRAGGARP